MTKLMPTLTLMFRCLCHKWRKCVSIRVWRTKARSLDFYKMEHLLDFCPFLIRYLSDGIRLIQELLCGSGEITMPFYLILLTFTKNGLKSMIVHLVTRFLGPYDKERYFLFINENRGYKNFNWNTKYFYPQLFLLSYVPIMSFLGDKLMKEY